MSNSPLVTYTNKSPNTNPRVNSTYNPSGKIYGITIHHAAGILTAKSLCDYMAKPANQKSTNYCIGKAGDIALNADENRRAWTSSNKQNDYRMITMEVSNSTGSPKWEISSASYDAMIRLCADICKRNNISKLTYTGNKNGTLTFHEMFANTNCPGPYIKSRANEICNAVNALILGSDISDVPPLVENPDLPPSSQDFEPFTVRVTDDNLNVRKGPGTNYDVVTQITDHGIYTIVDESNNWGKLKSGAGWIALNLTERVSSAPADSSEDCEECKTNEELAQEVIEGMWGNGNERIERLTAAGYVYKDVQAIVTKLMNAQNEIKAGDKVRVKKGASSYDGKPISPFVFDEVWVVKAVSGSRVVLDKNEKGTNSILTPFHVKDLTIV